MEVNFSKGTSTGVLHQHLLDKHKIEWFDSCTKLSIKVNGSKAPEEYAQYLNKPQFQPSSKDPSKPQLQYSPEGFVDAIAELVAGDDLVSQFNYQYIILIFIDII